jgi:uncharacterized membrane protein
MSRPISSIRKSVKEICEIEAEALRARSFGEKVGDFVVSQSGRMGVIIFHAIWFVVWLLMNSQTTGKSLKFDPFPYPLLTLVVSLESIFLSLFILISQNRSSRTADERSHLDLQINMLAEHESTEALKLLRALCEHHGLNCDQDPDIDNLVSTTKPGEIIRELKKALPTSDEGDHGKD